MAANNSFPGTMFAQIAEISDWEEGYVVWAFKFWLWIMERVVEVEDYDLISLHAWPDNRGLMG